MTVNVSKAQRRQVEQLKQEQNRLEELLFLIDNKRRPRVQRMIALLRSEIAAVEAGAARDELAAQTKSLDELRQRQSELEESLFREAPERRAPIKQLLAQVRAEIAAAVERLHGNKNSDKDGPTQAA